MLMILEKKEAQLMLTMLGAGAVSCKKGEPADAHDAGRGYRFWQKRRPS